MLVLPVAGLLDRAESTADGLADWIETRLEALLSTGLSFSLVFALLLPNKLEPAEVGSLLDVEPVVGVAEEEDCLETLGRGSALCVLLSPADGLEGPLCNMREAMVQLCKVLACGCDHAGPERANRSASGTVCIQIPVSWQGGQQG